MKRNWRSNDDPIYVPMEPVHLWWLLPIYLFAGFAILAFTGISLYLIVWSLV